MKNNLRQLTWVALLLPFASALAQTPARFDNISLSSNSYYNGSDFAGGFKSGDYYFTNAYDSSFGGFWSGFAVSNTKDDSTPGFMNQYSAAAGSGYQSNNYAVFYGSGTIKAEGNALGKAVKGCYITNNVYAYYEMKNGSAFSKKFGGASGNDSDYFAVEISGWKNGGNPADTTVMAYLADYRFANNANDYIVKNWMYVDLSILGEVDSLSFDFHSSDVGDFGINTPLYFCLDNFNDIANKLVATERKEGTLKLYPNPANHQLHIEFTEQFGSYSILDMFGKMVLTGNETNLDIAALPQGVYLLTIASENGVYKQKFIKE